VFPGSVGYNASLSGVLHEWKYLTKITGFTITPTSAAPGAELTVSGKLSRQLRGWHPYAHQTITIFLLRGSKVYYYKHRLQTNASGQFTGRLPVVFSARLVAQFDGNQMYFGADSRPVKVTAKRVASGLRSELRAATWSVRIFT
jgi:hypothetical protein